MKTWFSLTRVQIYTDLKHGSDSFELNRFDFQPVCIKLDFIRFSDWFGMIRTEILEWFGLNFYSELSPELLHLFIATFVYKYVSSSNYPESQSSQIIKKKNLFFIFFIMIFSIKNSFQSLEKFCSERFSQFRILVYERT